MSRIDGHPTGHPVGFLAFTHNACPVARSAMPRLPSRYAGIADARDLIVVVATCDGLAFATERDVEGRHPDGWIGDRRRALTVVRSPLIMQSVGPWRRRDFAEG